MNKITILYPNSDDVTFDFDYYRDRHMKGIQAKCGAAMTKVVIERGVGGAAPGAPAPYVAIGHLYFESMDTMQSSFGSHVADAMADIPNFTNSLPEIQFSEVVLDV
jgi:uncharacterized protein (TIGR02118 family)